MAKKVVQFQQFAARAGNYKDLQLFVFLRQFANVITEFLLEMEHAIQHGVAEVSRLSRWVMLAFAPYNRFTSSKMVICTSLAPQHRLVLSEQRFSSCFSVVSVDLV